MIRKEKTSKQWFAKFHGGAFLTVSWGDWDGEAGVEERLNRRDMVCRVKGGQLGYCVKNRRYVFVEVDALKMEVKDQSETFAKLQGEFMEIWAEMVVWSGVKSTKTLDT